VISGTKRHTPESVVLMPAFGGAYSDVDPPCRVTSSFGSKASQVTGQDVAELGSKRPNDQRLMAANVEGFGCRPIAAMRLAPWPASESLQ
jgi:hypothetical protein